MSRHRENNCLIDSPSWDTGAKAIRSLAGWLKFLTAGKVQNMIKSNCFGIGRLPGCLTRANLIYAPLLHIQSESERQLTLHIFFSNHEISSSTRSSKRVLETGGQSARRKREPRHISTVLRRKTLVVVYRNTVPCRCNI